MPADCKMADDCLCLLSYVACHHQEQQTWESLAEATGIPTTSLWDIIDNAKEAGETSLLAQIAYKHGFSYKVNRSKQRYHREWIIDVVKCAVDRSDFYPEQNSLCLKTAGGEYAEA